MSANSSMIPKNYTESEKKSIDKEFKAISKTLEWQKYFLIIGGFWPLEKAYIRPFLCIIYMMGQLAMEYAQLTLIPHDFDGIVLSIFETAVQTMVFTKMVVFRYSTMLRKIMDVMKEEWDEAMYENYEEKELYLKYNYWARLFVKFTVPYTLTALNLYYLRPILTALLFGNSSGNESLVLPFQVFLPIQILDFKTFLMTYAYFYPVVYFLSFYNAWQCLLLTIQLHICGQLSIVEHRIKKMASEESDAVKHRAIFEAIVRRHDRSVWMANTFDDNFHFVTLFDLTVLVVELALSAYTIMIGSQMGPVLAVTMGAILFLLYCFCLIGETLIYESERVHAAYYKCLWYKASIEFKRSLMICMIRSRKPLNMTAGKFFVFSLSAFTGILKTTWGYLSMLRNVGQ